MRRGGGREGRHPTAISEVKKTGMWPSREFFDKKMPSHSLMICMQGDSNTTVVLISMHTGVSGSIER